MEMDILSRVRKLNWVLQESTAGTFSFNELCSILSDLMDSNVYVANKRGKVIGVHCKIPSDSPTITDPETDIEKFPTEYNEAFLKVVQTEANLQGDEMLKIFKYDYDTSDKLHTLVPISGGGQRLGTLILTKPAPKYSDEDLALAEYGATVIGFEIQKQKTLEAEEDLRQSAVVSMAVGTLSYSEYEAMREIFKELNGLEGFLVASKVADRSGITRSVIVNALRKLESAGIIETRSLGMKGTYIKVLNNKFMGAIRKA
jgi:transcriptional pleiotropic repressor